MKLNKVLALALSGVMAVSMLAGCSGAPVNGEQEGEQEGPIAVEGDISDGVAGNIEEVPSHVKFEADSALSNSLNYVVGFANVWQINAAYLENDLKEISGRFDDLQDRLEKSVGMTKWDPKPWDKNDTTLDLTIKEIGSSEVLKAAEYPDDVAIDDAKAVQLYAASGVIEEDALNTLVAEAIEDIIKSYNHVCRAGGNNGIYDHSYTVSVSTDVKSDNGITATFVAVQVVRSSVRS